MALFGPIDWQRAIEMIIILLFSIDVHELAHAFVADRLGDPTPRRMGELSPNPFVHMDQFGILLLLLTAISPFAFTYGRTHVTPSNLKYGAQRGNAIVAAAGPLSNLILAALIGVVLSLVVKGTIQLSSDIVVFLLLAMQLNIILFLFNLIPLPPLDGFSILGGFLTARQMYALVPLQQWGPMVLLLIFFVGEPYLHIWSNFLTPLVDHVSSFLCRDCFVS